MASFDDQVSVIFSCYNWQFQTNMAFFDEQNSVDVSTYVFLCLIYHAIRCSNSQKLWILVYDVKPYIPCFLNASKKCLKEIILWQKFQIWRDISEILFC